MPRTGAPTQMHTPREVPRCDESKTEVELQMKKALLGITRRTRCDDVLRPSGGVHSAPRAWQGRTAVFAESVVRAARTFCRALRVPTARAHRVERHTLPDFGQCKNSISDPLTAISTTALRNLIERQARSAQDLRGRAARRAAMLDTPAGAPRSDPLYQRLFFALEGLIREIDDAQEELTRRTGARMHGGHRRTKLRIHPEAPTMGKRQEPARVASSRSDREDLALQ